MTASHTDPRNFLDTAAYSAAVGSRDSRHEFVAATMRELLAERRRFMTANTVHFELHGLLLNRLGRRVALETIVELHPIVRM